jgi:uncharacterized protein YkwD
MFTDNFFAHLSRDDCATVTERIKRAGLADYVASHGENLGYTAGDASDDDAARKVVDLWMNSKGHRENILNPIFNYTGIGAVYKPAGGPSWTPQGRPFGSDGNQICQFNSAPTPINNFYITTHVFAENDPDPD